MGTSWGVSGACLFFLRPLLLSRCLELELPLECLLLFRDDSFGDSIIVLYVDGLFFFLLATDVFEEDALGGGTPVIYQHCCAPPLECLSVTGCLSQALRGHLLYVITAAHLPSNASL